MTLRFVTTIATIQHIRRSDPRMLMVRWLLLSLALFAGIAQSQQSQDTPRIEAKVQTKNTVPPEQNSKADFKSPTAAAANTSNAESTDHAKNASDEGTEFWPPFFGYRLKITDTLSLPLPHFCSRLPYFSTEQLETWLKAPRIPQKGNCELTSSSTAP
ncbi:MAG: hypothetical protein M3436_10795 [Pseudomonadota bacterium]|nr:hypothetical protein [Pseudomonadota bacterium]